MAFIVVILPEDDCLEVVLSAKLTRNDVAGLSFTELVETHSTKGAAVQ